MAESQQAFWCRHSDGFAVVSFPPELSHAHMEDVRNAGLKVIEQLSSVKSPRCLVDLSALSYMGSSMVASIVRIWKTIKAQDGTMVIVAANEQTVEVLKASGLAKVWTIVDTYNEGVHALGLSPQAKVETRDRQFLTLAGPPAMLAAGALLAARVVPAVRSGLERSRIGVPPEWAIFMLGGMAVLASGISVSRERGSRRVVAAVVLGLSLVVLAIAIAKSSPPNNAPAAREGKGVQTEKSAADPKAVRPDAVPDGDDSGNAAESEIPAPRGNLEQNPSGDPRSGPAETPSAPRP